MVAEDPGRIANIQCESGHGCWGQLWLCGILYYYHHSSKSCLLLRVSKGLWWISRPWHFPEFQSLWFSFCFPSSAAMAYKGMATVTALKVSKAQPVTSVQTQTSTARTVMKVGNSDGETRGKCRTRIMVQIHVYWIPFCQDQHHEWQKCRHVCPFKQQWRKHVWYDSGDRGFGNINLI